MKRYTTPTVCTQKCFESSALSCGKSYTPPSGSHHFSSAYDTFTGHLGPGMGASSSVSPGQVGVGFGPGGTSFSYVASGICANWCTLSS
jgi:hypothetical protein